MTAPAVLQRLRDTPATALLNVGGNVVTAWSLESLPAGLRADLEEAWRQAEAAAAARPWRNLAHFVSEPPLIVKPRAPRARELPLDRSLFAGMQATLAMFADATRPTPAEAALLWQEAFTALESATAAGRKEKKAKRALLRWLNEQPFLAGDLGNLRRDFNRKLAKWQANGRHHACLFDGRIDANAARRAVLLKLDRDAILATAVDNHAGEIPPALNECREKGKLSREFLMRYNSDRFNIPKIVWRLKPEARILTDEYHRPRHRKANGKSIWTFHDENAGDVLEMDDITSEHYVCVPNEEGWWNVIRPQLLILNDSRSKKILNALKIPESSWNQFHVRRILNDTSHRIGLPNLKYHFENGTFRTSKMLGGALPWGDVEMTLFKRLGVKMSFAPPGRACAKMTENVGKLFQRKNRDLLGWCGPNEREFKIEAVEAAKRDVEVNRKTPSEAGLMTFDEYVQAIEAKRELYNRTEQESEVMGGGKKVIMSPDQAWITFQARDADGKEVGLTRMPDELRYIWATRAEKRVVGRNGICFHQGNDFRFDSADLALLRGVAVECYWDVEISDVLSVITPDRRVLTVPQEIRISRHKATDDELAEANRRMTQVNRATRARLSELKNDHIPAARRIVVSPEVAQQAQQIREGQRNHLAKQESQRQTATRAERVARKHGLARPATQRMADAYNAIFSVEPETEE